MQEQQHYSIFQTLGRPFRHPSRIDPSGSQLEAGLSGDTVQHAEDHKPSHDQDMTEPHNGGLPSDDVVGADEYTEEAWKLVRTFTSGAHWSEYPQTTTAETAAQSSDNLTLHSDESDTPDVDRRVHDFDYVPSPKQYKPSVFGALLNSKFNTISYVHEDPVLLKIEEEAKHKRVPSDILSSGVATPKKRWYEKPGTKSPTASMLLQAGLSGSTPGLPEMSVTMPPRKARAADSNMISTAVDIITKKIEHETKGRSTETQIRNKKLSSYQQDVVTEVADILARRRFLIKLCDAFMGYGAPTHRMEEYMSSAARALAIDADFMYIPGAMTCTFNDSALQTNTVELIRKREGLDFGRLKDVFNVYKCVIHEKSTAQEGLVELDNIRKRADEHSTWFRILMFGVASVIVGPFSFQARPIDFIPVFFLGCALGFLQTKVVPRSENFSNVFEVSAAVMTAFIARGLGSIKVDGEYLFCFSATAQSSIALILPGFMILNSALELQGRSVVAGSVRLVYAIVYTLFLGFGLLLGMTIYGLMDSNAVTVTTCRVPTWFEAKGAQLLYTNFMWVPMFACALAIIHRAKWSQLPVMALVSVCGYQAWYWISQTLKSNPQVANAVGAFVIGCVANLYSRLFHGLAATTMLPAIYCLVPGGLASSGSLVAGVESSEQIVKSSNSSGTAYSNSTFNVGYDMIQISIGLSVGLYLSALVVYPYGKRRSGLFSF